MPSEILAFKLLRRARLSKAEKLLVISGMNYQEKNTLYDQAKRSLKKFMGEGVCGGGGPTVSQSSDSIKFEPTYVTAEQRSFRPWQGYSKTGRGRGRVGYLNNSGFGKHGEKPLNPTGPDGRPLTCKSCGSFRFCKRLSRQLGKSK